ELGIIFLGTSRKKFSTDMPLEMTVLQLGFCQYFLAQLRLMHVAYSDRGVRVLYKLERRGITEPRA
ncbi:hypothetical protein XELAEV_18038808mg, partial [Xenopus laevis]